MDICQSDGAAERCRHNLRDVADLWTDTGISDRCFGYQSNVDSVTGYRRMGTSAEWDRIYDVRRDACGDTICGCSIDRIGYRNSEIVKENKEKQNYDKSAFRMPRHSSFTIMQEFVKWGNTGQNKADGKSDTTDLTTKGARLAV